MTPWRRALITVLDGLILVGEQKDRAIDTFIIDPMFRWAERNFAPKKEVC